MRSASKSAGPATATSYERLRHCSGVHSPVRPYIQKVKKMMKLNARLAAEGKPHKTCKPEGVIIPPGTVVKNHGENKPVLEDDPIGWLNSCAVVLRYTARRVNNLLTQTEKRRLRFSGSKQQQQHEVESFLLRRAQARSYRSRFITLFHAAAKSFTNASFESSHA